MAVKGNLQDMGLIHIITINCNEQKKARLLIRNTGREAAVFFEDGKVVHANLDSQKGEDVIYEVLTWKEGEFELEQGVSPPLRTMSADWSTMLLEGLRRIDELKAGLEVAWYGVETGGTEHTKEAMTERMARGLQRIPGVEAVLICSREGEIIGQDTHSDPVTGAALTAFVGRQAETLSAIVNAGLLKQIVLVGEKKNVMIVNHQKNYVGLFLAPRTSAEAMVPLIQTTMRRYR
jgi:predicted regulator of Ras-like GTPase activity (Roadblock/LC7/MglB family)